jgi:hypothetical protein
MSALAEMAQAEKARVGDEFAGQLDTGTGLGVRWRLQCEQQHLSPTAGPRGMGEHHGIAGFPSNRKPWPRR